MFSLITPGIDHGSLKCLDDHIAERLDAHGEPPRAVEKGTIADHGPRLSQPSRGVKPGRGRGAPIASS